ncbi:uncharacterized protein LOC129972986 isoform X1 [Argiope bruennichi]|uniref:uncharacterized protein LOC129972986 isoform X1 n=1 Tax=Argiope bruennichi TaxID=94029 RepID=UPI00249470DD|nr:uncharacterized protein LOC129972986 isoform X1 [Argiope bruennichi]
MMKWKVVKNPRCISADRSLECMRNKYPAPYISDNNNNEQPKHESSSQKESKQQDSGFTRKPSLVASDCINLKSFLGLTRQRSEINLSNLGLIGNETRRSRSEVRGISCDRLTIGYHTPSPPSVGNNQPGNASPPNKSGCWLRGRKKEREPRSQVKVSNNDFVGKTVVTGSSAKRTSSKSCDTRTVADQSGGSKTKKSSIKLPSENRKSKSNKKGSNENLLDEDIYAEIGHVGHQKERSIKENKTPVKGPAKHTRKKGQAPKPQIPNVNLKESNCDVNLNPNGFETKEIGNCFVEKKNSPQIKPSRKIQSANVKNEERHADNRTNQTAKINNLKNSEALLTVKNKINSDSNIQITVAEVHKNVTNDYAIGKKKNSDDTHAINPTENSKPLPDIPERNTKTTTQSNDLECSKETERLEEIEIEIPPYRIDTPDYSTLESVFEKNQNEVLPDKRIPAITNKEVAIPDSENLNYTVKDVPPDAIKTTEEYAISSILRDSSGENKYSESELTAKKMVRFEKLDLIETYKKNKAESVKDSDEDSVISNSDKKPAVKKVLDVNSNEINPYELGKLKLEYSNSSETEVYEKLTCSSSDCVSESSATSTTETEYSQKDIVNVLIRNPSPDSQLSNGTDETQTEEAQTQLVVKKSIVLTIAKQEKGFKSMCASKKPEVLKVESPPPKTDHKISVTFLCSDSVENVPPPPPNIPPLNVLRMRSSSANPENHLKIEVPPPLPPPLRGRSRERRSKDRQHCKKSHKSKKKNKEDAFHMPQAVIDELSQVLEKRKPSLDKKTPMQAS